MAKKPLFTPHPGMTLNQLHERLVHTLTMYDQKMSAKPKAHWSMYALSHLLEAAQRARDEAAESGATPGPDLDEAYIRAVASNLHPTPTLRTFLRAIDPTVDVERQRWVRKRSS